MKQFLLGKSTLAIYSVDRAKVGTSAVQYTEVATAADPKVGKQLVDALNANQQLVAALECMQALDKPYNYAIRTLSRYGFKGPEEQAVMFVQSMVMEALLLAKIYQPKKEPKENDK